MKIRAESFGGIIFDPDHRTTLYVDREYMKSLGYEDFPDFDHLSAPEVIHVEVTKKCPLKCRYCYAVDRKAEMRTKDMMRLMEILAEMNVFQVAFGGGEPFARDDFVDIASHAYDLGIVPNVTTNGFFVDRIEKLDFFGQINVSLDGAERETYLRARGCDGFERAVKAIKELSESYNVGINTVVSRHNFDKLHEILQLAEDLNVGEVMLIRVKPAGRGAKNYEEVRLSSHQLKRIDGILRSLLDYDVLLRVDCAFMPFLSLDENVLAGMQGCDCGISSIAVKSDGKVLPCSFLNVELGDYERIGEIWRCMDSFRRYEVKECLGCEKYMICRGGCRVFAYEFSKDVFGADVECLKVRNTT